MDKGKHHINPTTGEINLCSATIRCDFAKGDDIPIHFETRKEAQAALDEQLKPFAVGASLTKKSRTLADTISSGPLFDELEASRKKNNGPRYENGLLTDESYKTLANDLEARQTDVNDARSEFNISRDVLTKFSDDTVDEKADAAWLKNAETFGKDFDNASTELNKAVAARDFVEDTFGYDIKAYEVHALKVDAFDRSRKARKEINQAENKIHRLNKGIEKKTPSDVDEDNAEIKRLRQTILEAKEEELRDDSEGMALIRRFPKYTSPANDGVGKKIFTKEYFSLLHSERSKLNNNLAETQQELKGSSKSLDSFNKLLDQGTYSSMGDKTKKRQEILAGDVDDQKQKVRKILSDLKKFDNENGDEMRAFAKENNIRDWQDEVTQNNLK